MTVMNVFEEVLRRSLSRTVLSQILWLKPNQFVYCRPKDTAHRFIDKTEF